MWVYEKKLQYPIKIKNKSPKMAKYIISQFGGPDGELAAALRYLSQRFSMPDSISKGVLTDIGTEELAHLEIVGAIIHQLVDGVPAKILEQEGLGGYYTDHGNGVYPQGAADFPFDALAIAVKGDPITDLTEDLAAEEKARTTYEHLINISDDPDIIEPLKFLRQREVVHFQRFGETLQRVQARENERRCFIYNNNPCCVR